MQEYERKTGMRGYTLVGTSLYSKKRHLRVRGFASKFKRRYFAGPLQRGQRALDVGESALRPSMVFVGVTSFVHQWTYSRTRRIQEEFNLLELSARENGLRTDAPVLFAATWGPGILPAVRLVYCPEAHISRT